MICLIIFNDLDHKSAWSGSIKFMIWIKKEPIFFWSGSKNIKNIFDLDQKRENFFLIWIKNWRYFFWSGSKNLLFLFGPGSKYIQIWIKDHEIKKWSTVLIHDLPTVCNLSYLKKKHKKSSTVLIHDLPTVRGFSRGRDRN